MLKTREKETTELIRTSQLEVEKAPGPTIMVHLRDSSQMATPKTARIKVITEEKASILDHHQGMEAILHLAFRDQIRTRRVCLLINLII